VSHFHPGDHIVLRGIYQGKVWTAQPLTVVRDSSTLVALFLADSTVWKRPVTPSGEQMRLPTRDWILSDQVWRGSALKLCAPGSSSSVLAMWNAAGQFICWYVNLEEPVRRSEQGLDYLDQSLDIVVAADMSHWTWKDEEELAEGVDLGIYAKEEASGIRAEGERALGQLRAREPPFDERWEDWGPPPDWTVPTLLDGWDIVR